MSWQRQPTANPYLKRDAVNPVPFKIPVLLGCIAVALVCNYVLGKDMAWDTLNYHLYAGFSSINDRFSRDYFAAGPLSYFNPYAYLPFYLLIRTGLPALAIGSIFAVLHSFILYLSYVLGVTVSPLNHNRGRFLTGLCALALALGSPILVQELGSCFADISTGELALAGLVILARSISSPRNSRIVIAGFLLGAASALKLSNALPAICSFIILLFMTVPWRRRLQLAVVHGVALGIGFLIISAPWSYRLEQRFGNPMFPMFNNIFHSPEFSDASGKHMRFVPESLADALWRPIKMLDPAQMIHVELMAPDFRYALLYLLCAAAILMLARRVIHPSKEGVDGLPATAAVRALWALGLTFTACWALWLRSSGNSRYFIPMSCVAAALITGMLFQLCRSHPKVLNYVLSLLVALQVLQFYTGTEYRWNGAEWGGKWFDVRVPEHLKSEANLYLTIGTQSNSFLVPFIGTTSAFVNFTGGYALDLNGANGSRIRELVDQYWPNVKVLVKGRRLYEREERRLPRRDFTNDALQRLDLQVAAGNCSLIVAAGLPPDLEVEIIGSTPNTSSVKADPDGNTYFTACQVLRDDTDKTALRLREHQVDVIFDALEDACPEVFQPRRLFTEHSGDSWSRLYSSTDTKVWISKGAIKFTSPIRGVGTIVIGKEEDWRDVAPVIHCGRRDGRYFAESASLADSK